MSILENEGEQGGSDNPDHLGTIICAGGVAEAWKDNLLDKLAKEELEIETVEALFKKIQDEFGEMTEEDKKVEQLRTIEQGGRTCNKYIQEFKKIARGSGY